MLYLKNIILVIILCFSSSHLIGQNFTNPAFERLLFSSTLDLPNEKICFEKEYLDSIAVAIRSCINRNTVADSIITSQETELRYAEFVNNSLENTLGIYQVLYRNANSTIDSMYADLKICDDFARKVTADNVVKNKQIQKLKSQRWGIFVTGALAGIITAIIIK